MRCIYCGNPVDENATFCMNCGQKVFKPSSGAPVEPAAPDAPATIENAPKKEKAGFMKNKFNLFAVILTAVLAVTFLCVLFIRPKTKPKADASLFAAESMASMDSIKVLPSTKNFVEPTNWDSFTFWLGGVTYELPTPLSKFLENGWTVDCDDETLAPGKTNVKISQEIGIIQCEVYNSDDCEKPIEECLVQSVQFVWADAVLPGNIRMGDTHISDVYDAYGVPDYFEEKTNTYTWGGDLSEDAHLIITFNDEKIVTYVNYGCGKN